MEPVTIICNPTDGYAPSVPRCTRDHCGVCAAEVWVAPSSRAIIARAGWGTFLCTDCAPGVLATEADAVIEPPQPEQLRELRTTDRRLSPPRRRGQR